MEQSRQRSSVPIYLNVVANKKGRPQLRLQLYFYFIYIIIFNNPSAQAGYDTRSIFKRSLTGLNSEFSFFWTSCLTKAEEPSLSNYLPIAGGRIIGFIPFPRVLVLCEMQSVRSRIWTLVAVSISSDDNHYTTGTTLYNRNEIVQAVVDSIELVNVLKHSTLLYIIYDLKSRPMNVQYCLIRNLKLYECELKDNVTYWSRPSCQNRKCTCVNNRCIRSRNIRI